MAVTEDFGAVSSLDLQWQTTLAGTYTLEVSDVGDDGTGTYRVCLARLPGSFSVPPLDEGGALTNGDVHPGTIDLADVDI